MSPAAPKPAKRAKTRREAKPDPDKWFSLCVRERADWTCESCGKKYEPWTSQQGLPANPGLDCSHYIGRTNYAVRFHPDDADAHCRYCHGLFENDPHMFQEWKRPRLGEARYELLIACSLDVMLGKQMRGSKRELETHFKAEFERIREMRNLGKRGRLEFEPYGEPQTIAEAREAIGA